MFVFKEMDLAACSLFQSVLLDSSLAEHVDGASSDNISNGQKTGY